MDSKPYENEEEEDENNNDCDLEDYQLNMNDETDQGAAINHNESQTS